MKLLICLITYNRLEYTKRTVINLMNSLKCPFFLVIVDNASTEDGYDEYFKEDIWKNDRLIGLTKIIINSNNYYPGKACNIGWERGLREFDADYLMRCDNDMEFEPNWTIKAKEYFDAIPVLGQLGLDNSALDEYSGDSRYITTVGEKSINAWPGNVGGPCIIRREAYDRGARYDETPWYDDRKDENSMITPQEDVKFSLSMHSYQFIFGHPTEKLAQTFANSSNRHEFPEYYEKTMKERGYPV